MNQDAPQTGRQSQAELSKNWKSTSIAGKITAVVIWGVMPIAFAITIPLLSSLEEKINKEYLWKMEQIHNTLDQQFVNQTEIKPESLRNKLFALKNKLHFNYLKLSYSGKNITIGQKQADSSLYIHDYAHNYDEHLTADNPVSDSSPEKFNYSLVLGFPSIERGIELERMKFGSLIVIFTIILGLYLVYVIRNTLHAPFQKVIDATQSVTEGNLETRLDIHSNDEFGYLSRFFNHMVEELAIQQQRLTDSNKYLESVVENKEMALEESRAKSLFLANMSHEIRTPMTAIHGYAENLYRFGLKDKQQQQDAIETIYRNSKHLINIINDILDLSKIEADKLDIENLSFSPIKLLQEVEQLMSLQAREKGVVLTFHYQFPLPAIIHNDPTRLKQILFNLISNALKFTSEGRVTVTTSCLWQAQQLQFSVADNGIGLSDEQIAHLFQPYVQAKKSTSRHYGGTGLGLMIARRLVNLMGGDINVNSVVGEGSVFDFAITTGELDENNKLNNIAPLDSEPGIVDDRIPQLRGQVLLVEDIVDNQKLIAMYLRQAGLQTDIAENGREGLHKALNQHYDLILMDMQMPVMDGLSATRLLRESAYQQPIIALTANVLKNEREIYLQAGCNAILSKPIILNDFYATIKSWLKAAEPVEPGVAEAVAALSNDPFQTLVRQFLQSLEIEIKQIAQHIAQQDWQACQQLLHNIKGRGGSFGFPELTVQAGDLEALLKAGKTEEFQQKFSLFSHFCHTIISSKFA